MSIHVSMYRYYWDETKWVEINSKLIVKYDE